MSLCVEDRFAPKKYGCGRGSNVGCRSAGPLLGDWYTQLLVCPCPGGVGGGAMGPTQSIKTFDNSIVQSHNPFVYTFKMDILWI